MAGQTDNTDILTGMNELITSVNDLITATQNQIVKPNIKVSSNCGCPPVSDTPPVWTDVDDEDDPPTGWTGVEGTSYVVDARRCKMANYSITQLKWVVDQFVIAGVESYAATYVTTVLSMLVMLFSAPAVPAIITAMTSVFNWVNNITEGLVTNVIDLDALQTALAANEADLVCALYSATSTNEARSNVDTVLSTAGVSAGNRAVINAIYSIDWAAQLFFEYDDLIEAELDGFTPTYDCGVCVASGCQLVIPWNCDSATSGVIIPLSANQISYYSGYTAGPPETYWLIADFNTECPTTWCGPVVEVNNMTTNGMTPWTTSPYRVYNASLSAVWNSTSPPNWATIGANVRRIQFKSYTAFDGLITLES